MLLTGITPQSSVAEYRENFRTNRTPQMVTFVDKMNAARAEAVRQQNVPESAVDDFVRRHPDKQYQIERMVRAGEQVLSQYGTQDVDAMSLEDYKEYIYGILDRIPLDPSQQRDTQFIDITEAGWQQMKDDPKYEAWVVGYFKVDRAVKNPFANWPGVEPRIHTEHFGASIDEHLGRSYPQSSSDGSETDSEDWWKRRQERQEQLLEEAQRIANKRRIAERKENESHRSNDQSYGTTIGLADLRIPSEDLPGAFTPLAGDA